MVLLTGRVSYKWFRIEFEGGGSMNAWATDENSAIQKASKYKEKIKSVRVMSEIKKKEFSDNL